MEQNEQENEWVQCEGDDKLEKREQERNIAKKKIKQKEAADQNAKKAKQCAEKKSIGNEVKMKEVRRGE